MSSVLDVHSWIDGVDYHDEARRTKTAGGMQWLSARTALHELARDIADQTCCYASLYASLYAWLHAWLYTYIRVTTILSSPNNDNLAVVALIS
jgi:hypothetical protein